MFNTLLIHKIQIVIGFGQISEFVSSGFPDGAVGFNLIHRTQDWVYAQGRR